MFTQSFFKNFHEHLRTTDRPACLPVKESEHNLSLTEQAAGRPVNLIADDQLCHRHLIYHGHYPDAVSHLCRHPVPALHRDYRQHDTGCLNLVNRNPGLGHHVRTAAFEIPYIIGVMDNAHLVRFIVPDVYLKLRFYHNKKVIISNNDVLSTISQSFERSFYTFYL